MKGIALETMVGLIIAIIAAAVILLIIFTSGLVANFKETIGILIIMISAYTRIAIVQILNFLLMIVAIILMVVAIFSVARWGTSEFWGFAKGFIGGAGESTAGITAMQVGGMGLIGVSVLIVYLIMVNSTFAMIPFFGSTINVYLGDQNHPQNYTLVADEIASRIDTTWKAMGANNGNPFEGLNNKPNPFPMFVIFPYPNQTLNMSYVYDRLTKKFKNPDYDIYVFCSNSQGILGSKPLQNNVNPVCWFSNCKPLKYTKGRMHYSGVCNITNKSEIFIEYADAITGLTAPLAPSGIHKDNNCKYMTGVGDLSRDVIAVCIKGRS